jgi:branched-chain amino acid transport system permease protein
MRPALIAFALLAPLALPSQYMVTLALLTVISAALGQGWNLAGGFGGLTSFGHVGFFGLGAYTAALLQTRYGWNPWLGLPAAALVGALVGGIMGLAAFRAGLRGSYFALVTLAFAEAFRVLVNSFDFFGAGLGIQLKLAPSALNFQFLDRRVSYLLALSLLAMTTGAALHLRRSRFGARLAAVRESEPAAAALGIDVVRSICLALALSAALTAMGGVLYLQSYLYIDPSIAFSPQRSVEMLLVAMIGGAGTVWGPLLGALVLHIVADGSQLLTSRPGVAPMLYGVLLLAVVWLLPGGIARFRGRHA